MNLDALLKCVDGVLKIRVHLLKFNSSRAFKFVETTVADRRANLLRENSKKELLI